MDRDCRNIRCVTPVLLMLSVLAGCARVSPVAPSPSSEPAPVVLHDDTAPPPSRLFVPAPDSTGADWQGGQVTASWYRICEMIVRADRVEVVKGKRYELTFAKGSLHSDTTCTIQEYDPDVLDVQLGPHGIQFGEPVTLSIDFRDTAADPHSAIADGSEPVLWWWNEAQQRWEAIPGRTDWAARRHIVRLAHFSRYVLGGKAGWKQDPFTESE